MQLTLSIDTKKLLQLIHDIGQDVESGDISLEQACEYRTALMEEAQKAIRLVNITERVDSAKVEKSTGKPTTEQWRSLKDELAAIEKQEEQRKGMFELHGIQYEDVQGEPKAIREDLYKHTTPYRNSDYYKS